MCGVRGGRVVTQPLWSRLGCRPTTDPIPGFVSLLSSWSQQSGEATLCRCKHVALFCGHGVIHWVLGPTLPSTPGHRLASSGLRALA